MLHRRSRTFGFGGFGSENRFPAHRTVNTIYPSPFDILTQPRLSRGILVEEVTNAILVADRGRVRRSDRRFTFFRARCFSVIAVQRSSNREHRRTPAKPATTPSWLLPIGTPQQFAVTISSEPVRSAFTPLYCGC